MKWTPEEVESFGWNLVWMIVVCAFLLKACVFS